LYRFPYDKLVAQSHYDEDDWRVGLQPVFEVAVVNGPRECVVGLGTKAAVFFCLQLCGHKLRSDLTGSRIAQFEKAIDAGIKRPGWMKAET
jgi:hypothetical protein